MKKSLLTLLLTGASAVAFSQGLVSVYTISAGFANNTSATAYTSALNGVYDAAGTKTAATAGGYYYALLVQPYNAGLSAINPLDPNYTLGMMATNYLAGGIKGAGAGAGAPVANWGAPTGASYDTATRDNFLLVGWSSNLGNTWSAVSAQLQSGNWSAVGSFGVSALGNGYSGGGPNGLLAPNVFGASTGMPGGLASGVTMYATTAVPEPTTLALAALGGVSLLLFRRRK